MYTCKKSSDCPFSGAECVEGKCANCLRRTCAEQPCCRNQNCKGGGCVYCDLKCPSPKKAAEYVRTGKAPAPIVLKDTNGHPQEVQPFNYMKMEHDQWGTFLRCSYQHYWEQPPGHNQGFVLDMRPEQTFKKVGPWEKDKGKELCFDREKCSATCGDSLLEHRLKPPKVG